MPADDRAAARLLSRREALLAGAGVLAGLGTAPAFWRTGRAAAAGLPVTAGNGPYGPLAPPDANGIRLPQGFRSRLVAQGRRAVAWTGYLWHHYSDGAATFATPDGGWILVSNSEAGADAGGGASAIRFAADGAIVDAYRVLGGTNNNCSGGRTPWGTWLSCEETEDGLVWECDPTGARPAVVRPALGRFKHEGAAVDPDGQAVYLTEDLQDGGFYRFTPEAYPDLTRGRLEVAIVARDGGVSWVTLPDSQAGTRRPTRHQVAGMTRFQRGEGIYFDGGVVYVSTTTDSKLHAYDPAARRLTTVYDRNTAADQPVQNPDNLTVSRSGDIFVGEDSGAPDLLDLGIITPEGEAARFLQLTGSQHGEGAARSEVTGPTFDPSGTRLYFSSQRAMGWGQIYEITGPFRQQRAPGAPIGRVEPPASPAPALGIEVARRRSRAMLLRLGIPVALTLDRPARVEITASMLVASRGRRRVVRLARVSRIVGTGPERLRLTLDRPARAKVRRRRRMRVTVEIAIFDGTATQRARRAVLVTHPGR